MSYLDYEKGKTKYCPDCERERELHHFRTWRFRNGVNKPYYRTLCHACRVLQWRTTVEQRNVRAYLKMNW